MRQLGAEIVEDPHGAEYRGRTGRRSYWLAIPLVAALGGMLALGAAYPRKSSLTLVSISPSASLTAQPTARHYATLPPLITPAPTPFLGLRPLNVAASSIWRWRVADAQPGYPFAVQGKRIYYMGGPERRALMTIQVGREAQPTTLASVEPGFEITALASVSGGVIALERQLDSACNCVAPSKTPVALRILLIGPEGGSRLLASYSLLLPSEDAPPAITSRDSVLASRRGDAGATNPYRAATVADPLRPLLAAAGDRWAVALPVLVRGHWQSRVEFWDLQRQLWTSITAEPVMRLSVGGYRVAAVLRSEDTFWQLVLADSRGTGLQTIAKGGSEASLSADGRYLAWASNSTEDLPAVHLLDLEGDSSPITFGSPPAGWTGPPAVGSGSRGPNVAWIAERDSYGLVLSSPFFDGDIWLPCAGFPAWWAVQGDTILWASAMEGQFEWAGFDLSSARS